MNGGKKTTKEDLERWAFKAERTREILATMEVDNKVSYVDFRSRERVSETQLEIYYQLMELAA